MANETTQRPTPGVVGVLNHLIDARNVQIEAAHMPIRKMSHGDSVLQCLNILYETNCYGQWLGSDEGVAVQSETEAAAAEQLGLDLAGELTDEQSNLLDALSRKLLMQRFPKFDLFSTTEEAVEYWMQKALSLQEESSGSAGNDTGPRPREDGR